MKLIQKIKIYLFVLVTLLITDAIWLNLFSINLYKTNLNLLLSGKTNLLAGLVFYLIYAYAISYLVIFIGLNKTKLKTNLYRAFILGLASYSTFDLTGEAVFRNWPSVLTILDISWGSILSVFVTYLALRVFSIKK